MVVEYIPILNFSMDSGAVVRIICKSNKRNWLDDQAKLAVHKQDEVGSSTTKSAFADPVDHTYNYHAIHSFFFLHRLSYQSYE